jgi:hypothetical protein
MTTQPRGCSSSINLLRKDDPGQVRRSQRERVRVTMTPLLERLQGEWAHLALVTDGKPLGVDLSVRHTHDRRQRNESDFGE